MRTSNIKRGNSNAPKAFDGCFNSGCLAPIILVSLVAVMLIISVIGETPLTKAAGKGDLAEVQRLVEGGAAIDKKSVFGRTALEQALRDANDHKGDNYGVAEYLISKGAKFSTELFVGPILDGNFDFVKEMVERGYKLDPNSLAFYVCFNAEFSDKTWNTQLADYLLQNGSEININYYDDVYKQTYTPLGYASHYRDFEIVKYLVEKGADVNMPMKSGITPLALALEEYKANLDDNTGPGVHYYTIVPASTEIANYLKEHGAR
jgi:ankyrin repeat protein